MRTLIVFVCLLEFRNKKHKKLENQYSKDDLIDRLRTAVNRQLVSDVPIGTYLSSGIDTSTITSLANETNQKFSSITCGYENNQLNPEFGLDENKNICLADEHFPTDGELCL